MGGKMERVEVRWIDGRMDGWMDKNVQMDERTPGRDMWRPVEVAAVKSMRAETIKALPNPRAEPDVYI